MCSIYSVSVLFLFFTQFYFLLNLFFYFNFYFYFLHSSLIFFEFTFETPLVAAEESYFRVYFQNTAGDRVMMNRNDNGYRYRSNFFIKSFIIIIFLSFERKTQIELWICFYAVWFIKVMMFYHHSMKPQVLVCIFSWYFITYRLQCYNFLSLVWSSNFWHLIWFWLWFSCPLMVWYGKVDFCMLFILEAETKHTTQWRQSYCLILGIFFRFQNT
jgi:hypothetical protein